MKLTQTHRLALYQAMIDAFGSLEALRLMVSLHLGENLDAVAASGTLGTRILNLISWAESTDRIDALIQAARGANPSNEALRRAEDALSAPPAPAPDGAGREAAEAALRDLLGETFTADEIYSFVRFGPEGAVLRRELPEGVSVRALSAAAVSLYARRGLLDAGLLLRFAEAAPGREDEIREIEVALRAAGALG